MLHHTSPAQKLQLNWLGKGEQPRLEPRLLLLEPQHCHGDPNTENILIHGDNLLALKALEHQFTGKIKCIYIDPPYNTGSAFSHYDDMVEHSLWLTLIQQRLEILRRLLSPDGSIWISIDDNECHYLKVLCDEIFGRKNFVANVIWEKKYSPQNDAKWLSDSHDHILVFSKNKDIWRPNFLPRTEEMNDRYKNPDNDKRGVWKSGDLSVKTYSEATDYPIKTPFGRVVNPPSGYSWRVSKNKFQELVADNRIWFGKDGTNVPSIKRFLTEVQDGTVSKTIWQRTEVGDNQEAKKEVKAIKDDDVFATPKPERLIQRILTLATNPGDLVLDSFLGSGTTAAVAHKMGRRWIGIELGDHCYTHCVPRLQKVVAGTDQGGISKAMDWQGGGGFKTYRLAPSLLKADENDMLRFNPDFTDEMVAEAVAQIEGFTYAPDPEVFWKQSRSSEQDYLLVTKIFITREWLAQLHEQMSESESLLLCVPAYGEGCEKAFANISLKKIPAAFMRKYEFDKDDYSLHVNNVSGNNEAPPYDDDEAEMETPPVAAPRKGKTKTTEQDQPTLF
jgi:adenine-specific DNA-methyltransferase